MNRQAYPERSRRNAKHPKKNQGKESKVTEIKCDECGENDVVYVEDISCWRRVLGSKDGTTIVDGFYNTDGFDDGTNSRFLCRSCAHEWPADRDKLEFT